MRAGDRVKVTGGTGPYRGQMGTIVRPARDWRGWCEVQLDGGLRVWFRREEVGVRKPAPRAPRIGSLGHALIAAGYTSSGRRTA